MPQRIARITILGSIFAVAISFFLISDAQANKCTRACTATYTDCMAGKPDPSTLNQERTCKRARQTCKGACP